MGVGSRGPWPLWVFIHDTDKEEDKLMVVFSVLFFPLPPPPGNFSADALGPTRHEFLIQINLLKLQSLSDHLNDLIIIIFVIFSVISMGAVLKRRPQKIDPSPLFAKCSHWLTPLVRADTP